MDRTFALRNSLGFRLESLQNNLTIRPFFSPVVLVEICIFVFYLVNWQILMPEPLGVSEANGNSVLSKCRYRCPQNDVYGALTFFPSVWLPLNAKTCCTPVKAVSDFAHYSRNLLNVVSSLDAQTRAFVLRFAPNIILFTSFTK